MNTTIVLIASLLLAALLVWLEYKRPNRKHLATRLIVSCITVAALACIIIPIQYTTSAQSTNTHQITWLTTGATEKDMEKTKPGTAFTNDPALASPAIPYMPDLSWFLATHPDIKSIHVAGYGLNEQDLQTIKQQHIHLSYQPAPLPDGFTVANWNRQIRLGNALDIQGAYHNTAKDSIKLVLTGLGTRLDSTTIAADSNTTFRLHTTPSHTGNTLYELRAEYPHSKVITEKLPVTITPATTMQVLLLSSAPAFDNKFLINWLYEHKYQVIARHTVSKNKFALQALNKTAGSLSAITPSLLQTVDVLITDDQAIAALGPAEKAAIQTQVTKGMGIVLQADSTYALSTFSKSFAVKKPLVNTVNAKPLRLAGYTSTTHPILPAQWLSIESSRNDQPLVTDDKNTVLVACRLYGSGKVILNTVSNTFSWLLQGNPGDYAQFWSLLLTKAARKQQQDDSWQQATDFPITGHPVELTLQATLGQIPVIHTPDGNVHMAQHPWLPDTWTGTWWPVDNGWQTISSTDTTALYIYEAGDWTAARTSTTISNNTAYVSQQEDQPVPTGAATVPVRKKVPVVIFWLVFILGCAYLWIEAKFY